MSNMDTIRENLRGLSAAKLEELARECEKLATALRSEEPDYGLALANGVKDKTYKTQRYGWIASYSGTATITMEDGSVWQAIGHNPQGDAYSVSKEGWIEFFKVQ